MGIKPLVYGEDLLNSFCCQTDVEVKLCPQFVASLYKWTFHVGACMGRELSGFLFSRRGVAKKKAVGFFHALKLRLLAEVRLF